MKKKIVVTGKVARRIVDTGKAARRIDPKEVAKALGAERVPPEEEAEYRRRYPSL